MFLKERQIGLGISKMGRPTTAKSPEEAYAKSATTLKVKRGRGRPKKSAKKCGSNEQNES